MYVLKAFRKVNCRNPVSLKPFSEIMVWNLVYPAEG